MTTGETLQELSLLPNRFAVADFGIAETELILGRDLETQIAAANDYNWLGAYLVEQVGLNESEVTEWFRSPARSLGERAPIDVWSSPDGFEGIFEYAKDYKAMVDEALEGEEPTIDDKVVRAQELAKDALVTVFESFKVAGINIGKPLTNNGDALVLISNLDNPSAPFVRWKHRSGLEDFKIMIREGDRWGMYYIVRSASAGQEPVILQTGVVSTLKGHATEDSSDSDINGRPPSAGEIAAYVIPLAIEARNRSLKLHTVEI
jgi:hypothetical protein